MSKEKSDNRDFSHIVYVGYNEKELGGIQQITSILLPYFHGIKFFSAVKRYNYRLATLLYSGWAYVRYLCFLLCNRPRIAHILIASPADQVRNLPYIYMSRLFGTKILVQFRYNIGASYSGLPLLLRRIVNSAYQCADVVAFLADGLKIDLESRVGSLPSVVIPNPISGSAFNTRSIPLFERKMQVIYLGRYQYEKGIDDIIEAAKLYYIHNTTLEFHFHGDGVIPNNCPSNCFFHGWISGDDKFNVIADSLALILPSHNEAFPNVLLESMACGTPVISTGVGGVPDMIKNDVHGIIIPPKCPDSLCQAIIKLITNQDMWNAFSNNCRKESEKYHIDIIMNKWIQLYNSMAINT